MNKGKFITNTISKNYLKKNCPLVDLIKGKKTDEINFKLTKSEECLFEAIRNTIELFKLGSTARVAGGWVRDKVKTFLKSQF